MDLEFVFVIFIKSNSILNNISKFSTFGIHQDFVCLWQIEHLGPQIKRLFWCRFKILIPCFCWYAGICLLASPFVSPSVSPLRSGSGGGGVWLYQVRRPQNRRRKSRGWYVCSANIGVRRGCALLGPGQAARTLHRKKGGVRKGERAQKGAVITWSEPTSHQHQMHRR